MPGPSVVLVPRLMARFVRDRPAVQVALLTRSSAQVRHLVATQQFDVGLCDWIENDPSQTSLLAHQAMTFDCLCAVPASDALARAETIAPDDLRGRDMAALYPNHPTCLLTRAAFAQAGVTFAPRFQTQYFHPLLNFVEAGLACAVIDPLSADSYRLSRGGEAGVLFRPFLPAVLFTVAIVTPVHRPLSGLARSFAKALGEELRGRHRQVV